MKIRSMVKLTSDEISKLKKTQMEILLFFKNFCEKNGLTFFLFGGTLLGSIRHNGFIPWDDDIDVCMPRKDYDAFLTKFVENEEFFILNTKSDSKYFYHFSKLVKKNTSFVEYTTQNLKTRNGIFIDIFPINGVPGKNEKVKYYFYNTVLFILNKRTYPSSFISIRKNKRDIVYKTLSVLSFLALWWAPYNLCAKWRDAFMKSQSRKYFNYCICGTNLRKRYDLADFSSINYSMFENHQMPIMSGYKNYLKLMYGDYMKMPKIEDRIPHHYLVEIKFYNDDK